MKNHIKIIIVLLICFKGFSQEIPLPKITKSVIFKDEYKNSSIHSINSDGKGGVIVIRIQLSKFQQEKIYTIETYDKNLNLVNQKEYDIEDRPKEIRRYLVLGVITKDDKVNIIDYFYNNNNKKFVCTAKTFSANTPNFIEKELFSFDGEENFESNGKMVLKAYGSLFGLGGNKDLYENYAKMMINNKKSAFAVSIKIKDKKSEKFKMYTFSSSLEKKLEHDFDTKVKNRNFTFDDFDLSPDGNSIYLLSKVKNENSKDKKKGGKYEFVLSEITSTTEKNLNIDTKLQYCQSLTLLTNGSFLKCVGFYSEKNDFRYKGIVVYDINVNGLSINKSSFNPFTSQFLTDKYGKVKDKELRNLEINDFKISTDNEIIINAEERFVQIVTSSTGTGGMYSYPIFHFNDIVSTKINAEDGLVWARNINKKQSTTGQGQSQFFYSFTSASVGKNNYLFVNASEKPKKISNDRIEFKDTSKNSSNINMIRFDENGNFNFIEILDNKQNEMPFLIGQGVQVDNSIYFLGRDGKKKQLLRVSI